MSVSKGEATHSDEGSHCGFALPWHSPWVLVLEVVEVVAADDRSRPFFPVAICVVASSLFMASLNPLVHLYCSDQLDSVALLKVEDTVFDTGVVLCLAAHID